MNISKFKILIIAGIVGLFSLTTFVLAGEQPVAIFHAFDQTYIDVESYICELPNQDYSHIQIAPAAKIQPE